MSGSLPAGQSSPLPAPEAGELLALLSGVAGAVRAALAKLDDWGPSGERPGQYRSDVVADDVCVGMLLDAGLGVLSEETGLHAEHRRLLAVVDPVDGSTNAARGLPWYATSICVLDEHGPLVALVVNQATHTSFEAVRGGGARQDGTAVEPSGCTRLARSLVGLSGSLARPIGSRQYRSLGAAALDLCAVASGALDGFVDCGEDAHGPWDYLGGLLVCQEAGAAVVDAHGRDLVVRAHGERRTPVAAATAELLDELLADRAAAGIRAR